MCRHAVGVSSEGLMLGARALVVIPQDGLCFVEQYDIVTRSEDTMVVVSYKPLAPPTR